MKPRDYQVKAIQSIWDYFREKEGNPVVAMPQGTGKSHVIAGFCKSAFEPFPNIRILNVTHDQRLIEQNFSKFIQLWPSASAGIYSAGVGRRDIRQAVIYCGIQSVFDKADLFGHIDLMLVDECHLMNPVEQTRYAKFIAGLMKINPNLKIIGFSATPFRQRQGMITEPLHLKKRVIAPIFTDFAIDMTGYKAFNWFINQGYLSPVVSKRPKTILDTEGLKVSASGDFSETEQQRRFDKAEITEAALREDFEDAHDRDHVLIFGTGIEHCEHICDMLITMGIAADVVHSKKPAAHNRKAIADFKAGKLRALVNNGMLTTGFDCPEIDAIIILRAMMSSALWSQIGGRGTRPLFRGRFDLSTKIGRIQAIEEGGKFNCKLYDHGGNTARLGFINDPIIPRRKGGGGSGEAPLKLCPMCGTENHPTAKYCGGNPEPSHLGCGHEFIFETKIGIEAREDAILKEDEPVYKTFPVKMVTYDHHLRANQTRATLKVSYSVQGRVLPLSEYICLEHTGYARHKAKAWWNIRHRHDAPETVNAALSITDELRRPTHIKVIVNRQYPEIVGVCFDGSGICENFK